LGPARLVLVRDTTCKSSRSDLSSPLSIPFVHTLARAPVLMADRCHSCSSILASTCFSNEKFSDRPHQPRLVVLLTFLICTPVYTAAVPALHTVRPQPRFLFSVAGPTSRPMALQQWMHHHTAQCSAAHSQHSHLAASICRASATSNVRCVLRRSIRNRTVWGAFPWPNVQLLSPSSRNLCFV
jgi:hypothetical protein